MDCVEIFIQALKGICDSFHGFLYIPVLITECVKGFLGFESKRKREDSTILDSLKRTLIYNGIFTVLIVPVIYILFPVCYYILSMTNHENFILSITSVFYCIGIIFRIFPVQIYRLGHFYLFQDIAEDVHKLKNGKPQGWESVQVRFADMAFNFVVQFFYGTQLLTISLLPTIWSICFPNTKLHFVPDEWFLQLIILILTSIWYSLCLFEYKWYYFTWNLHRRLGYIEKNWPYFIGFSFFYAVVTTYSDSYCVNALIAGYLFPFYLISTYHSEPEEDVRICSIPFFQPAVMITNFLIKRISMGTTSNNHISTPTLKK
ncbi:etoposide-induced protein 2.4 homolog [Harmonia axyridis]|uniref:etoposide-induced protein 2.4 homolog n=1 Tax=Harmonia axyridis TaxID=115357 RepID=UPI001E277C3F|nr:etoposide-induced protein 2.4 homolog [Harmonia axyridis]